MEKEIQFIAIDDNPIDTLVLKEYANAFPFLKCVGTFLSPSEAIENIEKIKPDLVFLDIEMPEFTGIDVLRKIRENVPMAVFITSHAEFAIDGYELSALDYILKPLSEERFAVCANRIADYWQMKQKAILYEVHFEQEALIIKEGHSQVKLPQHEIIYLEAMQDYTKVVTDKKNYLTLTTLGNFMDKLSTDKFLRIHRSYGVAIKKITKLDTAQISINGLQLPIGKSYRSILRNLKLIS
ncbi:MAG: LytTR family DNA-binding domain-containing protein [Ferruginibacter sp.]